MSAYFVTNAETGEHVIVEAYCASKTHSTMAQTSWELLA